MTASNSSDADENPYLALRAAKIARNMEMLEKLGLAKSKQLPELHPPLRNGTKRKAPSRQVEVRRPTRRSTRNRPDLLDDNELHHVSLETIIVPARKQLRPVGSKIEGNVSETKARAPRAFAVNSVRRINISVAEIIKSFLGQTMSTTGKATVIQNSLGERGRNVSFNKFSGVQEWGNDAIYLWVNIGCPQETMGNAVKNDFPSNGRQFTWFGGSRMHDDSPVIQNLIRIGLEAKAVDNDWNGVVLWCRHWNPEAKTYHPYTCLGRLAYSSHVPGSYPLAFVWDLIDYDRLKQHEDPKVRERFDEITHLCG